MSLTPVREDDPRAAYIKGLRDLADTLERHAEVPLPYHGTGAEIAINDFLHAEDPRAQLAAALRAFPGVKWEKSVREDGDYFDMTGRLHGLSLRLTAYREAVCERVVTGTKDREVEEVIEPAKTRKVVKPVEIVEWRCHPVLAPATQPEGPAAA